MPSQHKSDEALALTDKSVHDAVCQVRHWESDGQVVVDQAHEIAQLVSQALQQHGRNCLVISLFLLSAAAEVWETMNQGLAPKWTHVRADDPHMESHPFFPKTVGYGKPVPPSAPAPMPTPAVSLVPPPHPQQMLVLPTDSLPHAGHEQIPVIPAAMTTKGKQPNHRTHRFREDSPGTDAGRKKHKHLSKAIISNTEDEGEQPRATIIVKRPSKVIESLAAVPQKLKCLTTDIKQAKAVQNVG
ncbi:hypothetical protein BDR07DRAFT_1372706 [Suillus spraguei]|nr:hypothetical protein BDR07DRAFT_1372706 [Suillus spraguei]